MEFDVFERITAIHFYFGVLIAALIVMWVFSVDKEM